MNPFEQLLVVQDHDTKIDQLNHRRETLPERTERANYLGQLERLDGELKALGERQTDLSRTLKRREDELAALEDRIAEVDKALYGGAVTSPREAVAMQEELASLGKRRGVLEENVIEALEQLDPVTDEVGSTERERDAVVEQVALVDGRIAALEREIDDEVAVVEGNRAQAATEVGEGPLAEYEALRRRLGGVAVARLSAGACGGCNLQLSAVEVDRIKHLPVDETVYCEECGRLLVR